MISESRAQAYAERMRETMSAFICTVLLGTAPFAAVAGAREERSEVRVAAVLEAPLDEVRRVLLELEGYGHWFPHLRDWRVLERSATGARVYGRQALPWPIRDRDYVVHYRWWDGPDGAFLLEATGVANADPAATDGVVRLESLRSLWTLSAEGTRTRASYHYEGPSAGRLLDWLAKIGERGRTRALMDGLAEELGRRRRAPN